MSLFHDLKPFLFKFNTHVNYKKQPDDLLNTLLQFILLNALSRIKTLCFYYSDEFQSTIKLLSVFFKPNLIKKKTI